jgi:hypothetical protein
MAGVETYTKGEIKMTEFEKWFEQWLKNNPNCIKRGFYHASKIAAYESWRAALEWVLKECDESGLLNNPHLKHLHILLIQEELESLKNE